MNVQPQKVDKTDVSTVLEQAGWGGATVDALGADMGLRRYYTIKKDGKTALLMDMSRAGILETGLKAYLDVGEYLTDAGVRTPHIHYSNLETGFSVIENLGSTSFGDVLKQGQEPEEVYALATDVLIQIKNGVERNGNTLGLKGYKKTLIYKRLGQFVDYYMPMGADRMTTQADHDEFQAVWAEIEKDLPSCPLGFCHADYHLENLIWAPDLDEKYGLIDFQDAFWGFAGYDLLNLLEDARSTVPDDIKAAMKARYCEGMSDEERAVFEDWYVVMSAQFHCRVIGLFIKFSAENETKHFLQHIPRLQGYITKNLENPVLSPLKEWLSRHSVQFDILPSL